MATTWSLMTNSPLLWTPARAAGQAHCLPLWCVYRKISFSSASRKEEQKREAANSQQWTPAGHQETELRYTKCYHNRNPRNLELLGVAEKPRGFGTKKARVDYYHRLMLDITNRHVSAYVEHNSGQTVVRASTKEFCISRFLYKTSDIAAARNVGRVLAERCKQMGLYRVMWEHQRIRRSKKAKTLVHAVSRGGITLNEPRVRAVLPAPGKLPA